MHLGIFNIYSLVNRISGVDRFSFCSFKTRWSNKKVVSLVFAISFQPFLKDFDFIIIVFMLKIKKLKLHVILIIYHVLKNYNVNT